MKYPFKNKFINFVIQCIDAVGYRFFKRTKRPFNEPRKVLVIRLDHIGDIATSEVYFHLLKRHYPNVRLVVLTSPAGQAILKTVTPIDAILSFDCHWFQRDKSILKQFSSFFKLIKIIKNEAPDIIVDLRGDLRHILALAIGGGEAYRVGSGVTGGGFLLDYESVTFGEVHVIKRVLDLLRPFGIPADESRKDFTSSIADCALSDEVQRILPKKDKKWIALHIGAGTSAKEWPLDYWTKSINRLDQDGDFYFICIGDKDVQEHLKRIKGHLVPHIYDLTNRLSLQELGAFLKQCDCLVSPDSGPVHIAAAHDVATVVLFSGANRLSEWRPISNCSKVLYHDVPCAPCFERSCPKERHFCMEGIGVDEVVEAVLDVLGPQTMDHGPQKSEGQRA